MKRLLFIAHPLLFFKENVKLPSRYEFYEYGTKAQEGKAPHIFMPEYVLYGKDILFTLYWSLRIMGRHELFIGIGNLNALSGILLRMMGFANYVIYYVIDFVPKRFQASIVNTLYHFVEKISALFASATWNLSPRMIDGREEKWKRAFPRQLVVPHGVHYSRITRVPVGKFHAHEIVYMGSLLEKQGIQLILEALVDVKQTIPDVSFILIGKGPYKKNLERLVKKHKLSKYVTFLGYIDDHKRVENIIAKASLAVALYDKMSDRFSYYADPGKIKNYLGAGVPVLMTDVPYVAKEIERNKCGFVVKYDKREVAKKILDYFSHVSLQEQYRRNAEKYAKQFDWDRVFKNAFDQTSRLVS